MPRLSKIGAAALAAFGWTSGSAVSASYLVVAGGGAGGLDTSGGFAAGGGGAGGLLTGTASLNPTLTYTITIGAGAAVAGTSGSDSVFSAFTSIGGGSGGYVNISNNGATGGSGGGGGAVSGTGGAATSGQGNAGGTGTTADNTAAGGGGGAGAIGGNGSSSGSIGGAGGNGVSSSISGSSVTYAGGGGGGAGFYLSGRTGTGGTGGTGGGGAGSGTGGGTSGTANLGGGGGGSRGGYVSGGNGGSGIVIISYVGAQQFSGGVVTSSGGNTIHTFTTSGTLGPVTPLSANYLVVAGGGGGGGSFNSNVGSGGGGAGGLLSGSSLTIDPYSTYVVTVGGGGTGAVGGVGNTAGTNGANSAFSMVSTTAIGGGYGAWNVAAGSGGSGGGATDLTYAPSATAGSGTSGQGNAGANATIGLGTGAYGGGGGGAGAAGSGGLVVTAGNGGVGLASSISGASTYYAGGGGGGAGAIGSTAGSGGNGGGGTGGFNAVGSAGTANTGGGGGGAGTTSGGNKAGGNGGSGVVIISYAGSTQLMAGGVVTIAGGNVIHTFNSSGYLTPLTLVNKSLRFRSSASAYLNRTPASAGNRQIMTFSTWVKLGSIIGSSAYLISANTASGYNDGFGIAFSSGTLDLSATSGGSTVCDLNTTQVFRDPSAWYHVVYAIDTTQATSSNRIKLYINGVQVTSFSTATYPSQNASLQMNNTVATYIGRLGYTSSVMLDGYLTEVNFIDGQALAPTAFGTFNSYGVWQPITYGGSYGTNGFRLPFTNNASTTTLGYDFSPQGNNWTTNNISVTSGSTYDSMTDVPTLTSATAANFATWNPLWFIGSSTFSSGNLIASCPANNGVYTTMYVSTGKWYAEVTPSSSVGGIGVNASTGYIPVSGGSFGYNNGDYSYLYSGNKMVNNGTQSAYGSTWTTNDVIGIAIDADAGTVTMYKNNVSQGAIVTGLTGKMWVIAACSLTGTFNMTLNNGAGSGFTYTPPTGYLALNTFNL